ncbi:domain of Kin17 curved DNA-binding protein-domain-containing protein [Mycena polygramma]|nr:domain of Kin17 curved DNA-binding protein-domain-containing protein [Mycena polygramma]
MARKDVKVGWPTIDAIGTPKYVANKMKSKGLQRACGYCQTRDENGFKCHAQYESHLRQMARRRRASRGAYLKFLEEFQSEFVALLSPNKVYQEYISDKSHLHMNYTRWVTLTEFVKHLGRAGIARVDETENGWFLAWPGIDSSPKALAKAEASLKKDRATTSDEQRERLLIADQIERAKSESSSAGQSKDSSSEPPVEEGLKRDENAEKVVLSFSAKPAPAAPAANPLKRPNVFKAAASSSSTPDWEKSNDRKRPALSMTAAERLIIEDQERKRRRMDKDNPESYGMKPSSRLSYPVLLR